MLLAVCGRAESEGLRLLLATWVVPAGAGFLATSVRTGGTGAAVAATGAGGVAGFATGTGLTAATVVAESLADAGATNFFAAMPL